MQWMLRIMQSSLKMSMIVAHAMGFATESPSIQISNEKITSKDYTPDAAQGFYHYTRFDWSGVIGRLKYEGHDYYGSWFSRTESAPAFYDFNYDDTGVVSAPFTAMVGPGEEFNTDRKALGFDEAQPGGTFIKIGVGVLRKPDDSKYDHSKTYEIVDRGKWTVKHTRDSVTFTHEVHDPASGYGYLYTKIIRLTPGKPQMTIEHTLKNLGTKQIVSTVYDHNFWPWTSSLQAPDW